MSDRRDVLVRQLQGALGGRAVHGILSTTTPTIIGGTGWSLVRNGAGDVTVTLDKPLASAPAVTAIVMAAGTFAVRLQATPTTSAFRLQLFNTTTGALSDGTLCFIAIG